MAGYEYRGTDSRRRRAEEFSRRRDAAEAARKRRAASERAARRSAKPTAQTAPKPAPKPQPKEKPMTAPARTEFAVVRENPPARAGARTGTVAAAARSAVAILANSPGEWFRVANRDTRAKALAYASTLRGLDHRVETRTVLDVDGKGGVLYARIDPNPRGEKK